MRITITGEEFTTTAMRASWSDDGKLSAAEVDLCVNAELAFYGTHTGAKLPGWAFEGGAFSGPAHHDAVQRIVDLQSEATDWVIENMAEITAEANAKA